MNKACLLLMLSSMVLSGCAESSALIKANSTSIRTDVFEELTNGEIAPQGYTDLHVFATLKTHKPGMYQFEKTPSHGTPEYRLLVNIDGQAMKLQGILQKENIEPRWLRDPEAGDGIRYRFGKNLRLRAGAHNIVVALPDDGIAVEREIDLAEGRANLVLEPIYSTKPGKRRPGTYSSTTSFIEGISSIRLILNNREI